MRTKFEKPGTFAPPGLLGRTIRLAAGITILYMVFPPFLRYWQGFTRVREGWEMPGGTWYIGILFAVYLLPHMIDPGFTLRQGRRSQIVFGLLALAAVVFDLIYYGSLWAPPLGWLVLLTTVLVFGHLGISFIVAGLFATPG